MVAAYHLGDRGQVRKRLPVKPLLADSDGYVRPAIFDHLRRVDARTNINVIRVCQVLRHGLTIAKRRSGYSSRANLATQE